MLEQRYSDNDVSKRDIPSFIEPRPPLIKNPFMRPRPQKGTNLLELFEEDSEIEESEYPELVQVYLRLKPCSVPNTLYEVRSDRCLVTSLDTATAGHGRRTQHNVSKMYTFSKIFDADCEQKEIFEVVVKENLKRLPDGHNFTLLTYGASGSGKTYTLMGTVRAPGLVPRSLEYVFRIVDAAQEPAFKPGEGGAEKLNYTEQEHELQWVKRLRHVSAPLREKYRRMSAQLHGELTASTIDLTSRIKHYVWVSFVEIYNEAIYDLLAPPDKRTKLRIREDSSGQVYVKDATQAFVRSGEEAYDVMVAGKHNLVVAATGVHANSSRSHCIFTITMLTETDGEVRTSYVRLCDLAGCERARATRNTGARMQESRAINSSLHVLERCLHMLRRKQRQRQDALVPYRESKLTRLLGSGLSGCRGEAVSMVVTLNPAPQYAHETKHVLSLAAVAQDIQINSTVLASTLEISSQDTTVSCSSEVIKLRADNERLHFELVQAQARNRELMAAMEERQQEAADTMRELVEEAKDFTREYYEAQLDALKSKMDEMMEDYESREQAKGADSQNEELVTEIALLKEKLSAERLARARAEKEVQHLRTCIEERDEKGFKETTPPNDVMALSDNELDSYDDTEDPFNESLEPIFRKELNRSIAVQDKPSDNNSVYTKELQHLRTCIEDIDEKGFKETTTPIESMALSDNEHDSYDDTEDPFNESLEPVFRKELSRSIAVQDKLSDNNSVHTIDNIDEEYETVDLEQSQGTIKNDRSVSSLLVDDDLGQNGTNVVDDKTLEDAKKDISDAVESNDTHIDDDNFEDAYNDNVNGECKKNNSNPRSTYYVKDVTTYEIKLTEDKLKRLNSCRGTYFVNSHNEDVGFSNTFDSSCNVNEEKSMVNSEKLYTKVKITEKIENSETLVSKIIKSLKSTQNTDSSLRQFEQLEMAAKSRDDDDKQNETIFGDIKILKEKRNYFDDNISKENLKETRDIIPIVKVPKEKRTFFDNIDVNVEPVSKTVNEIKQTDDERSPPIVKDVVPADLEPSTIKKLIGKSITKPDVLSSVHKSKFTKKPDSMDIFEGLDSPGPVNIREKVDNIEIARMSIERLVNRQSAKKITVIKDPEPIPLVKENYDEKPVIELIGKPAIFEQPVNKPSTIKSVQDELVKNDTEPILTCLTELEPIIAIDKAEFTINTVIKQEIKLEPSSSLDEPNTTEQQNVTKVNNTIEEFENIYKDLTNSRATEFELLVSHNESNPKSDLEQTKYNLRNRQRSRKDSDSKDGIILEEYQAKSEMKPRKRALRLRRRKDNDDQHQLYEQCKLKDIVNLQEEFCDVTMGMQASTKEVKDIPSPEKSEEENLPSMMGIQSCPSKSVTRSRRKLYTPRAEPLEEPAGQAGAGAGDGTSTERVNVPRPSYHRPRAAERARRKLGAGLLFLK